MTKTLHNIKIIIADDHEIFRDGFRLMLSKQPEIELLAEAENGKQLLELTEKHRPDLVITDIKMPVMDGIEATQKIVSAYPAIGIIGLSMFDEDDLIIDMLEAGARGYLLKNANKDHIREAMQAVYSGDPYYCRTTSKKLTQMIAKSRFNPYVKKEKISFTEKEKEIIQLTCNEYTSKQIAEELFLSVRTVEGHKQNIFEKMNVSNSIGLVIYAIKNGLAEI